MSDDLTHIKDLVPDPKNRRTHTPRNVGMIVDALHKVGAGRSIVIDENNEVLAGNATIEAAGEAGITQLKVVDASGDEIVAVRRTGLTTDQKRDLAIYDNRTGELAEWDVDQLLKDVEVGVDLSSFFREDELSSLLDGINSEPVEGLTSPDDVPAPRATDIKTGDLFALGDHRLLCGDSTKAEDVDRLMDGKKAKLMVADPPYGMNLNTDYSGMKGWHKGKKHSPVHGDSVPFDATAVVCDCVEQFWFGADYYAKSLGETGNTGSWLVWDKRLDDSADKMFGSCFELIWSKQRHKRNILRHLWAGFFTGGQERTYLHPTEKPVSLVSALMQMPNCVGAVYDPFSGSGTSFIAAEQLNRRCFALEIEPSYCQVTIDRWEAFTGKKAIKVGAG